MAELKKIKDEFNQLHSELINRKYTIYDAFDLVLENEGWYEDDPKLIDGETILGIKREAHPDWPGWKLIDELKEKVSKEELKDQEFIKDNYKDYYNKIIELAIDFYKKNYWDKFYGDKLPGIIPYQLFNFAINAGNYKFAIKKLQQALNYINYNLFPDLVVDGIIGKKTLNAINKVKEKNYIDILFYILKSMQYKHYLSLMDKNPEYKKYRGWFRRVEKV